MAEHEFAGQVTDAYEHLYDLVRLRTHPLVDLLISAPDLQRKEKAWQLHRLLLQAIDEMDPGSQSPPLSHEWRRHRLLVLHYVDGLDPQSVADQLGISRRHYYREHEVAMEALVGILWEHRQVREAPATEVAREMRKEAPPGGLELLRVEAARLAKPERHAQIGEVTAGVLALVQEVLHRRQLVVCWGLPEELPSIPMDPDLLRQMLLAMLGQLIESGMQATIELGAAVEEQLLCLTLRMHPRAFIQAMPLAQAQERISALQEMASLAGARIVPLWAQQAVVGFEVHLPSRPQRTILVVDDNEDVLALFQRYLRPHHYQVATARTARDALVQARRLQPYAMTLDLMIPEQDGWDLLQVLLNQPDTRHIPVIVCSVLKQKDLALSLGATAFLEKPVTEQALVSALAALGGA